MEFLYSLNRDSLLGPIGIAEAPRQGPLLDAATSPFVSMGAPDRVGISQIVLKFSGRSEEAKSDSAECQPFEAANGDYSDLWRWFVAKAVRPLLDSMSIPMSSRE